MKKLTLPLTFVLVLAGCVSSDESVPPVPPIDATFKALFVPAGGLFPFPNDLFFSGSTDGTVNMPVKDPTDVGDYLVAMNGQDGYSTTAPMFVPFNGAIDPATITAATVKVINVTNPLAPFPLTFGTSFSAGVSPASDGTAQLMITPLVPLTAKNRYAIIITRGITSGGTAAGADITMQELLDIHTGALPVPPALAPLYTTAGLGNVFSLANAFGVTDANIAVVFTVSTQSTTDVMAYVNTNAAAGAVLGSTFVGPTNALNPALPGFATVYQGVITMPYYQSKTAPMTAHWHTASGGEVTRYSILAGGGPAVTQTLNIPIMMSIPNATSPGFLTGKPTNGWPVIIFQHGITGNRTNMLGMADAAAAAGFAVVAIDQPLHGLVAASPLKIIGAERTFDLDVSNNTTGAPVPDGVIDSSGQNYINLSSLLTSRDNLRQSAADLIRVAKTIPLIDIDGGGVDLDPAKTVFVGHSLGAIVGTVFLGVNTNVQGATLAMPGGTIGRLLRDSATFGPRINAGLASNGVIAGTQLYEAFLQAAQTAVDSGDPINFAAAANTNHSIHLIQVVGDGSLTAGHLVDQVVPNSSTARLIAAMGLVKRSANGVNAPDGYVNFTAGDHSSILSPAASAAAFSEMQSEMAKFAGSLGTAIVINTATGVIQP